MLRNPFQPTFQKTGIWNFLSPYSPYCPFGAVNQKREHRRPPSAKLHLGKDKGVVLIKMQGTLPYKRSTEFFRREVRLNPRYRVSKHQLHINHWIETATVERWFQEHLQQRDY